MKQMVATEQIEDIRNDNQLANDVTNLIKNKEITLLSWEYQEFDLRYSELIISQNGVQLARNSRLHQMLDKIVFPSVNDYRILKSIKITTPNFTLNDTTYTYEITGNCGCFNNDALSMNIVREIGVGNEEFSIHFIMYQGSNMFTITFGGSQGTNEVAQAILQSMVAGQTINVVIETFKQ